MPGTLFYTLEEWPQEAQIEAANAASVAQGFLVDDAAAGSHMHVKPFRYVVAPSIIIDGKSRRVLALPAMPAPILWISYRATPSDIPTHTRPW